MSNLKLCHCVLLLQYLIPKQTQVCSLHPKSAERSRLKGIRFKKSTFLGQKVHFWGACRLQPPKDRTTLNPSTIDVMVGSFFKKQKTEQYKVLSIRNQLPLRVVIYDKIEIVQYGHYLDYNKNFEFESVHNVGAQIPAGVEYGEEVNMRD